VAVQGYVATGKVCEHGLCRTPVLSVTHIAIEAAYAAGGAMEVLNF